MSLIHEIHTQHVARQARQREAMKAFLVRQAQRDHERDAKAREEATRHAEIVARAVEAVRRKFATEHADSLAVLARKPAWQGIAREVADKHGTTVEAICSDSRKGPLVRARQAVMYRLRTETDLSYPQIGQRLGDRDHTTVLHGVRMHAKRHGLPVPTGACR